MQIPFVGPEIDAQEGRRVFDYDADTGHLTRRVSTGTRSRMEGPAGGVSRHIGYVIVGLHGMRHYAHRLIWLYCFGEWPRNQIDHINRDKTDNRLCNLRDVSPAVNRQNMGKQRNNTSGVIGVWWHAQRGKWAAEIKIARKKKFLGLFDTFAGAVEARAGAELVYHPIKASET